MELLLKAKVKFEFPVKWGSDLQSEHERYLTEKEFGGTPLFVTDYPKDIKVQDVVNAILSSVCVLSRTTLLLVIGLACWTRTLMLYHSSTAMTVQRAWSQNPVCARLAHTRNLMASCIAICCYCND